MQEVYETYEGELIDVEVSQNRRGRSGNVYFSIESSTEPDNYFEEQMSVSEFRSMLKAMLRADEQLEVETEE